jgi:hypothetical protein
MAQMKMIHDPIREILPIDWDDPEHMEICE